MYAGRALGIAPLLAPARPARRIPRDPYVPSHAALYLQPAHVPVVPLQTRPVARFTSATWAVVSAALIGLVTNFAMHLVNLRMQNLGISGSLISLSVAIQAAAICLSALAARQVVGKWGLR